MNTSESARNKWIAGGAILVMLLASGSILRIRSLQGQAAPSDPIAQAAAINASLALSPEEQKRRLELVTHLRDTWRPWAKAHQTELRRMLSASASDTKVRDAMWDIIPTAPGRLMATSLNLGGDVAKGESFNWNPISRGLSPSKISAMPTDQKSDLDNTNSVLKWNVQSGFSMLRDIELSESSQTGMVSVSLWASGRVTENTDDGRGEKTPEGFWAFTYKRKEILPPYEFLTAH